MKKTFSLQWHITDKCDQRCKHCYIYAGQEKIVSNDLELATINQILDNYLRTCQKMDMKPSIALTGGDPLLRKDIWVILKKLKECEIEYQILGNPFHLDLEIASKLKQMGCASYQLSIDGLKETHDYIRKPGSFESTLNAIHILNDAHIKSAIMTTVSKYNINDIPDLVDIIVENEATVFGFARYCPNKGDNNLMVSPKEYKCFLEKMWRKFEQYKDSKTSFILKDHLWTLFLYEKGLFPIPDIPDVIVDGCHCGITHMTILANGDVYACRRCNSYIGHVPEEFLYDIFMGDKMEYYRQFDKFEYCKDCELLRFCRGCPAVASCLTGDFYAKDPQCWKNIKNDK